MRKTFKKLLAASIAMSLAVSTSVYAGTGLNITDVNNRKLYGMATTQYEDCGVSAPGLASPILTADGTAYIIIGDSRGVALDIVNKINATADNHVIFAAAGEGYNYMTSIALPSAQLEENSHPEVKHWKYVIMLGLNDMENISQYQTTLGALAATKDVTFVSVNPVEEDPAIPDLAAYNVKVRAFNAAMKQVPGVKYFDTYTWLTKNGFRTMDKIHYDGATSVNIYNLIKGV